MFYAPYCAARVRSTPAVLGTVTRVVHFLFFLLVLGVCGFFGFVLGGVFFQFCCCHFCFCLLRIYLLYNIKLVLIVVPTRTGNGK